MVMMNWNESKLKLQKRSHMDPEADRKETSHTRSIVILLLLCFVANLANISPGMSLGFSAIALPTLQDANGTWHISEAEGSWVASLASIATPIGCLISGPLLDKFGRRSVLLSLNIPCCIGWFLICFANGDNFINYVYAGRVFTGLATGMGSAPATVYSAEVATESLRGMLVTWTSIAISLGIVLVYSLGAAFQDQWQLVAGVSAGLPIFAIILTFIVLPESPAWLLSKGRRDEAEKMFKRIRGVGKKKEASSLLNSEFLLMASKVPPKDAPKENISKILFRASTIKPLIIMNMFFFFQQFAGIFVVIFYAVDIVLSSGVTMDPYLVAILIGLTRFLATIVMSFVSNRFGRRIPAIISGAGMTIFMTILATYLYLQSNGTIPEDTNLGWIPVTSLILYILTSTIGFLTLPWAMIGEVYPSKIRGLAAGITTCFAYICSFVIVKVYPNMKDSMGTHGVYFFYAGVSFFATIFVIFFLPETKGKTLLEIEEYFSKKRKVRDVEDVDDLVKESDMTVAPNNNTEKL